VVIAGVKAAGPTGGKLDKFLSPSIPSRTPSKATYAVGNIVLCTALVVWGFSMHVDEALWGSSALLHRTFP